MGCAPSVAQGTQAENNLAVIPSSSAASAPEPLSKANGVILNDDKNDDDFIEPTEVGVDAATLLAKAALSIQRRFRLFKTRRELRNWVLWDALELHDEQEKQTLFHFYNEMLAAVGNASPTDTDQEAVDDSSDTNDQDMLTAPQEWYLSHVVQLANFVRKENIIPESYLTELLKQAYVHLEGTAALIDVKLGQDETINIVGDLHGQLFDLFEVLNRAGWPSEKNQFLFNGDFVDRGDESVEVTAILFALQLAFPKYVRLNRGNHEENFQNQMCGFHSEIKGKYPPRYARFLIRRFNQAWRWLPLAHVIQESVLVLHGGLFADPKVGLQDIRDLKGRETFEHTVPPEKGWNDSVEKERHMYSDIVWSDPERKRGRKLKTKRGAGVGYGPDVTKNFLEENGLTLLIRSHESVQGGYDVLHQGQCITIFSASSYHGWRSNKGAFIRMRADCTHDYVTWYAKTCSDFYDEFTLDEPGGSRPEKPPQPQELRRQLKLAEMSLQQKLRELIFRNKQTILLVFEALDIQNTGFISRNSWANGMGKVFVGLTVPWMLVIPCFVNVNQDNQINYKEWVAGFKVEHGISSDNDAEKALVSTLYTREPELRMVFQLFDKDGSLTVTRSEFREGLEALAKQENFKDMAMLVDKSDQIFNIVDLDHSGEINMNEFFEGFRLSSANN